MKKKLQVSEKDGPFTFKRPLESQEVIDLAKSILEPPMKECTVFSNP